MRQGFCPRDAEGKWRITVSTQWEMMRKLEAWKNLFPKPTLNHNYTIAQCVTTNVPSERLRRSIPVGSCNLQMWSCVDIIAQANEFLANDLSSPSNFAQAKAYIRAVKNAVDCKPRIELCWIKYKQNKTICWHVKPLFVYSVIYCTISSELYSIWDFINKWMN